MTDKKFLEWLHDRLVNVHGEIENVDHMHKLRAVIRAIPENQTTPNVALSKER